MSNLFNSTEVTFVNTSNTTGTILLPSVSSLQGRVLTFKDVQGTWGRNAFRLSTAGTLDKFEDGTNQKNFQNLWGATTLYGGANNRWYIIGGSQYEAGTTTNITTSSLQATALYADQVQVSTITFQNSLSPLSVSTSLLMYGSTILGPSAGHTPFVIRSQSLFQPSQLSGVSLWLDATDQNTLIVSGGLVTQWNDKSGNGRNATAPGSVSSAGNINGIPTPRFSATTNSYFGGNVSITGNVLTAFSVFTMNSSSLGSTRVLSLGLNGAFDFNNTSYIAAILRFSSGFGSYRGGGPLSLPTATQNVPTLLASVVTGASNIVYLNGTGATPVATTGNFNIVNYLIGTALGETGTQLLNGDVGEVLLYNVALTTAQIQQVEGYLAWKWELVGNLPASHPYKNRPP